MASDNQERRRLVLSVTRALPHPVIALLAARHDVRVNPDDRSLTSDELQHAAVGADALIVTAFDRLDAAAIAALNGAANTVPQALAEGVIKTMLLTNIECDSQL